MQKCRALDRVHHQTVVLLLRTWFGHWNSLCKRSAWKIMDYRNGASIITTARGISTIVALSSIHFSLGHSAAVVRGPINIASQYGVPKKYAQPSQVKPQTTVPIANTVRASYPNLLASPIAGSPNVNDKTIGITNQPS